MLKTNRGWPGILLKPAFGAGNAVFPFKSLFLNWF